MKSPWQHKVTLIRNGQDFTVNNPTPYYVIIRQGGGPSTRIRSVRSTCLISLPATAKPLMPHPASTSNPAPATNL